MNWPTDSSVGGCQRKICPNMLAIMSEHIMRSKRKHMPGQKSGNAAEKNIWMSDLMSWWGSLDANYDFLLFERGAKYCKVVSRHALEKTWENILYPFETAHIGRLCPEQPHMIVPSITKLDQTGARLKLYLCVFMAAASGHPTDWFLGYVAFGKPRMTRVVWKLFLSLCCHFIWWMVWNRLSIFPSINS